MRFTSVIFHIKKEFLASTCILHSAHHPEQHKILLQSTQYMDRQKASVTYLKLFKQLISD